MIQTYALSYQKCEIEDNKVRSEEEKRNKCLQLEIALI